MKKTLLIVFVAVVVLVVLYFGITYKEPVFKTVELETNGSTVYNTTKVDYLDTIVYVGLNELSIGGVTVILRPLLQKNLRDDRDLKAHIVATDHNYIIFTGSYPRSETVRILCHELIHLQQYHSGRLIVKNDKITWQGETSDLNSWMNVRYENRPWEQEAFQEQNKLKTQVEKVLIP